MPRRKHHRGHLRGLCCARPQAEDPGALDGDQLPGGGQGSFQGSGRPGCGLQERARAGPANNGPRSIVPGRPSSALAASKGTARNPTPWRARGQAWRLARRTKADRAAWSWALEKPYGLATTGPKLKACATHFTVFLKDLTAHGHSEDGRHDPLRPLRRWRGRGREGDTGREGWLGIPRRLRSHCPDSSLAGHLPAALWAHQLPRRAAQVGSRHQGLGAPTGRNAQPSPRVQRHAEEVRSPSGQRMNGRRRGLGHTAQPAPRRSSRRRPPVRVGRAKAQQSSRDPGRAHRVGVRGPPGAGGRPAQRAPEAGRHERADGVPAGSHLAPWRPRGRRAGGPRGRTLPGGAAAALARTTCVRQPQVRVLRTPRPPARPQPARAPPAAPWRHPPQPTRLRRGC